MNTSLSFGRAHWGIALSILLSLAACSQRADPARLVQQAEAALAKGDQASAAIYLKSAVQAAPANATVRLHLARLSLQRADFGGAEIEARKALELGLDPVQGLPLLLEALALQGEAQKLMEEVGRITHPDAALRAHAQTMVGRALLGQGKNAEAAARFEAALRLKPGLTAARVGQWALRLAAGDNPAGLRGELDEVLARQPDSFEAQALSARLALIEGHNDLARKALVAALHLRPHDLEQRAIYIRLLIDGNELQPAQAQLQDLARLAPRRIMTLYLKGMLALRQGNLMQSGETLDQVTGAAPGFVPGLDLAAEVALQSGDVLKAENLARQSLARQAGNLNATRLLAASYLTMNAPERALAVLAPLVNGRSAPPALLAMTGEALIRTGDSRKGIQFMDAAARAAGDATDLRVMAAQARLGTGDESAALQTLEAAAREDASPQVALSVARSLASAGRLEQARALAQRYVKAQPGDAGGFVVLGRILAAGADKEQAAQAFQQALALNPQNLQAVDGLVVLDLSSGQLAQAQARYQALIQQSPRNVPAYLALARLGAQNGLPEAQVLAVFKQARDQNPGSALLMIEQSRYMIGVGQGQGAAALLQPLVAASPDDLPLADGLATALEAAGDTARAIAVLERALAGNGQSTALHFRIGMMRNRLGDFGGALASFQRALDLQPHSVEPKIAMAGTLHNAGRKAEAYAAAKALQESLPRSPAGASLSGDFLLADGKPGEALAQYRHAFELAQGPATASNLYKALLANDQSAQAQALLRKWWSDHPGDVGTMVRASEWLLARRDWKEAVAVLNEVLKVSPNHTAALNNAAIAVHQLREPKALQLAERAYQLEPHNPSVMDTYGWILSEQGRGDEALRLLSAAAARLPRDATVQLHLAEAQARNGDRKSAAETARRLLAMNLAPDMRHQADKLVGP